MRTISGLFILLALAWMSPQVKAQGSEIIEPRAERPNILIAITDDHSWPDLSIYGSRFVETPNVDRVAKEGFLFENAYAASPGCAPSRAALLTGQHHWMIGAAGTHASGFPAHYETFVDILEQGGYKVGYTGKGWGPGSWHMGGRTKNPAGVEFNEASLKSDRPKGIAAFDYASNFDLFMEARNDDEPFYFWFGSKEPHLRYEEGPRSKEELARVDVPGFMPDTEASRSMLLDYADEINHFDVHLGKILDRLEEEGELDNTLIIITADNGMPMPRAKANGYDYGVHIPLIMLWANSIKKGERVKGTIGFVDISATILDAAGLDIPDDFVGHSVMNLLNGEIDELDYERAVYSGRERHSSSRHNNLAYPQRIMRSGDYLLVWNAKPERYPAGAPLKIEDGRLVDGYHDIDDSVSKRELLAKRDDPYISQYFRLSVDKRPEWELFDVTNDPYNLTNLATSSAYKETLAKYQYMLLKTLKSTGDLRVIGLGDLWEDYPRVQGPMRYFPKPESGEGQ